MCRPHWCLLLPLITCLIPVNRSCSEVAVDPVTSASYCLLADHKPTGIDDAVAACAEQGYFLVSVDSQSEGDFLSSRPWWSQNKGHAYWVRVMYKDNTRDIDWLKWMDCHPVTWTNWEATTFADGSAHNSTNACAYSVTNSSHRWRSAPCDSDIPDVVVCEKEEDNCLIDVNDRNNHRQYCYMTHQTNFSQASQICQSFGYKIAQFETQEEMFQVFNLFAVKNVVCFSYSHYWLGLESNSNSEWHWSDGTPVSWSRWQGAPPNITSGCGAASSANDRWEETECSEKHVFLCEKSTVTVQTTISNPVLTDVPITVEPTVSIQPSTVTELVTDTRSTAKLLHTTTDTVVTMQDTTSDTPAESETTQTLSVTVANPTTVTNPVTNIVINVLPGHNSVNSATNSKVNTHPQDAPGRQCGELPDSPHRMVSSQQRSLNSVVTLVCSPGYVFTEGATGKVTSEVTTRCHPDGQWRPHPTNCSAIACPPVPVWNNLYTNSTERRYQTAVNVSCQPRFHAPGGEMSIVVTCLEGGKWHPPFPRCESKQSTLPHSTMEATYGALFGGIGGLFLLGWIILLLYLDIRFFRKIPRPKRKKRKKDRMLEQYRNNKVVPVHHVDTPLPARPTGVQRSPPSTRRKAGPELTVVESVDLGETVVESVDIVNDVQGGVHMVNVPDHPANVTSVSSSMTALL